MEHHGGGGLVDQAVPIELLENPVLARQPGQHQNIVHFWYAVEEAAINAVQGRPSTLAHGIRFEREADYLFITLPSGRRLAYYCTPP